MLKSLSTQFAATLFFGPLGLAYSSVAAAVFLTLVLAVLFFSELGILSLFIVWPISIVVGLVFVKLHNDDLRSSGSRLLLGPGDDFDDPRPLGTLSSWGRGIAVVALVLLAGFVAYLYLPDNGNDIGRIVSSSQTSSTEAAVTSATNPTAETSPVAGIQNNGQTGNRNTTTAVIAAKDNSDDSFAVIALPEREVATVIIDNDGNIEQGEPESALNSGLPELTVDAPLVNLRRGPGTGFDIITQVQAGDKLFEFARDGNWINVETAASGDTGWIYSRLVR